jgi:hypothetical protein
MFSKGQARLIWALLVLARTASEAAPLADLRLPSLGQCVSDCPQEVHKLAGFQRNRSTTCSSRDLWRRVLNTSRSLHAAASTQVTAAFGRQDEFCALDDLTCLGDCGVPLAWFVPAPLLWLKQRSRFFSFWSRF